MRLKEEFCEIECPNFNLKTTFQTFHVEIQHLTVSKQELMSSIATERREIENKWQQQLVDENERHSQSIERPSSQRGRNQVLQSLDNSIRNVRSEGSSESLFLQETLANIRELHTTEMNRLAQIKTEVERTEEIAKIEQHRDLCKLEFDRAVLTEKTIRDELSQTEYSTNNSNLDWNHQINEIKQSIVNLENVFRKQFSRLSRTLYEIETVSASSLKEQSETDLEITQQSKRIHLNRASELERNITEEHARLADQNARYTKQINKHTARNERRLTSLEKTLLEARNEHTAGRDAILAFYTEKAAVLTAKLDDMKMKWDERPSRQCDLESIDKLTIYLQTVKMQLGAAFTSLKQSRKLLVKQDESYNRQFGRTLAVGILTPQYRS
jgi:hypothetical protein